jgi:competence protein ComEC
LHPGPHDRDLSRNDRSIVVRIETPCGAAIVPGDLEATGEDRMIDSGVDPNGTLLIVGHHGAGDASSARFLDAVGASHAGISAGRNNRFGHPDRAVLERLDTRDVAVRRSDHDGQVAWTCVHGRWQVEASAGDQ